MTLCHILPERRGWLNVDSMQDDQDMAMQKKSHERNWIVKKRTVFWHWNRELLFYKDAFGSRYPTKVDMLLNKVRKLNQTNLFMIS